MSKGDKLDIFYEFKSWASLPPDRFEEQFLKDLANPEISSLDQIKWVFDSAKVSEDDMKEKMLEAIENLDEDALEELASKFKLMSAQKLIIELKRQFDNVFLYKP